MAESLLAQVKFPVQEQLWPLAAGLLIVPPKRSPRSPQRAVHLPPLAARPPPLAAAKAWLTFRLPCFHRCPPPALHHCCLLLPCALAGPGPASHHGAGSGAGRALPAAAEARRGPVPHRCRVAPGAVALRCGATGACRLDPPGFQPVGAVEVSGQACKPACHLPPRLSWLAGLERIFIPCCSIGIVERTQGLGTPYFLKTTALLFLLSPAVSRVCGGSCCSAPASFTHQLPCRRGAPGWPLLRPSTAPALHAAPALQITVLLYHLLIHAAHKPEYAHTAAVGFSCVLFGWMALLSSPRHPGALACHATPRMCLRAAAAAVRGTDSSLAPLPRRRHHAAACVWAGQCAGVGGALGQPGHHLTPHPLGQVDMARRGATPAS